MGTEILYPQDILGERFRIYQPVFHHRESYFVNGNGFENEKANHYGHRKQVNHHWPERLDTKRKPTSQQTTDYQFVHISPTRIADLENSQLKRSSNIQYRQLHSGLEIGRDTVLRRGRSLDSIDKKSESSSSNNNNNNKKIKIKGAISVKSRYNLDGGFGNSLYAGSATAVSPAPESLPLPSFFSNNNNYKNRSKKDNCDAASRDLRRLLRLD